MLIKNLAAAGLFALSFHSGGFVFAQTGAGAESGSLPGAGALNERHLNEGREEAVSSFRERPPRLELQTGLSVFSSGSRSLSRLPIALQLQLPLTEIPFESAGTEGGAAGLSGLLRAGLGWMERSAKAACFESEAELAKKLLFDNIRPAGNCRLARPLELYFEAALGAKASIPHDGGSRFSSAELSAAAFHGFSSRWPRDTGYSGHLIVEPFYQRKSKVIPGIGAHALYYQNRLFFGMGFHLGVKFN